MVNQRRPRRATAGTPSRSRADPGGKRPIWVECALDLGGQIAESKYSRRSGADALFFLGDPSKARANADRVSMLYSEERDGHLLAILSHDRRQGLCSSMPYRPGRLVILNRP